jgi:hypothetical protein
MPLAVSIWRTILMRPPVLTPPTPLMPRPEPRRSRSKKNPEQFAAVTQDNPHPSLTIELRNQTKLATAFEVNLDNTYFAIRTSNCEQVVAIEGTCEIVVQFMGTAPDLCTNRY